MNHGTHHCLVALVEPCICYAKASGKVGQPQRRCVCYTRKEFVAIASYALTHHIYPGSERMGILCGVHPATGKVWCDFSIEIIGSRE